MADVKTMPAQMASITIERLQHGGFVARDGAPDPRCYSTHLFASSELDEMLRWVRGVLSGQGWPADVSGAKEASNG